MVEQPLIYDVGDTVALGTEVYNAAGVLADAGSVSLTVVRPDGTSVTPLVSKPATGVYAASLTASQIGTHTASWVATGTNAAAWSDTFTVRDATLLPVVSLDEAKRFLSIASDSSDEELRTFIEVATQAGERYTGRAFSRRTEVHTFTRPSGAVTFPGVPILTVVSVVDDGVTLSSPEFMVWRESGVVEPTGAWQGDLTITAVVGYTSPPAPIRHGVLLMLRHLWDTQRGTTRMGMGGDEWNPAMGFTYGNRVREQWDRYRIPGFG